MLLPHSALQLIVMLLFRKNRGSLKVRIQKTITSCLKRWHTATDTIRYLSSLCLLITIRPTLLPAYSVCGVPRCTGESGGCADELQHVFLFPAVFQVFLAAPVQSWIHWASAQRLLKLKMLLWAESGRGLADAESLSHVPNSPLQQGCRLTLSYAALSTEGTAGLQP